MEKTKEEIELEKFVFGDLSGFDAAIDEYDASDSNVESGKESDVEDESLFYVEDNVDSDPDKSEDTDDSDTIDGDDLEKPPIWMDSDEDKVEVSLTSSNRLRKLRVGLDEDRVSGRDYERRLRLFFLKMHPKPKWSTYQEGTQDAGEDGSVDQEPVISNDPLKDILSRQTSYVSTRKSRLLPTQDLDIQRLTDITRKGPLPAAVQALQFHPTHPLCLEAGYDASLRLYNVDGKANNMVTSLHIKSSPFRTALFHPDGGRVFAGGRRRYLYIWNVETGSLDKVSRMYGHEQTQRSMERFVISPSGDYLALIGGGGWMNVLSSATGQWVAGAKIDDGVIADIKWHSDRDVTIVSTAGDVYIWDMVARQFSSRWRDVSAVGTTSLARTDRFIAIGASNGMVNIYDDHNASYGGLRISDAEPLTRQPNFVLDNLVTSISTLEFSPDGQMLLMASRAKKDAMRMVHVPSFSVFRNWPTSNTPLGRVTATAFAPHSGIFTAGNEGGYVRLWSLNHYAD